MAAVLACGSGAVLSHRDAAYLHGVRRASARTKVDVTVRRGSCGGRPGIDVHRPRRLDPRDVTVVDGIPCTTVHRTLVDLGDVLAPQAVERAMNEAEVLRVFDLEEALAAIERAGRRRGARVLAALAAERRRPALTRSEIEDLLLAICDAGGIPRPETNAHVEVEGELLEVDALFRRERVAVEVDSYKYHGTRAAFVRDRARDRLLRRARWEPVRYTDEDLTVRRSAVARELRELLGLAPMPGVGFEPTRP